MAGEKPSSTFKLQVNDRVKRTDSPGCYGTVKDIRHEVTATSGESKDKGLLITVLWDNGTFSYFGPEGLQALTEK
jgi:hypothetical protein